MDHNLRFINDRMKKHFLSESNSDILRDERTKKFKADDTRFDMVRVFTRFSPNFDLS